MEIFTFYGRKIDFQHLIETLQNLGKEDETMLHNYRICESNVIDEDNKIHTVYGIELYRGGVLIKSYPDVFFEKEKAERLTYLCNALELSPLHFLDVIEDALTD